MHTERMSPPIWALAPFTTSGGQWPALVEASPAVRSMYRLPSSPSMYTPSAFLATIGVWKESAGARRPDFLPESSVIGFYRIVEVERRLVMGPASMHGGLSAKAAMAGLSPR